MAENGNPTSEKTHSEPSESDTSAPVREVELSGKDARSKLAELLDRVDVSQSSESSKLKQHKFWNTQPVPQTGIEDELEPIGNHGEPFEVKTIDEVQKRPYSLIDSFQWSQVDVTNESQLEEVYKLLNENYVEDTEAMFRFDYSREFLRWALLPPGWHPSWHVGVRVKSNGKLVAFITAIPATICVHSNELKMVEINFLCVHKKLRSKRLAPVLIREVTRLVNLQGIWQASYTAGAVLPRPVSSSRYFHRSLNPKKLIEVGFSRLQPRMTLARTIKLYALKSEPSVPGIRVMEDKDVGEACALVRKYLSRFEMHVVLNEEDFRHWYMPRDGVVYTYVVENAQSGKLTDVVSFYSLPSSIIRHPMHNILNAAYAFCSAALETPIVDLMRDALMFAQRNGFDVFNALDLARHGEFLKELKFHIGDGELNYYLYNWKCRPIPKEKNALVLL